MKAMYQIDNMICSADEAVKVLLEQGYKIVVEHDRTHYKKINFCYTENTKLNYSMEKEVPDEKYKTIIKTYKFNFSDVKKYLSAEQLAFVEKFKKAKDYIKHEKTLGLGYVLDMIKSGELDIDFVNDVVKACQYVRV